MKHYEVNFIVDPVLSGQQIKEIAQKYQNMITDTGATITAVDELGLRQLAYQINRRSTGIYYCVEFSTPKGDLISDYELQMRRDDNILRFLTVALDKYGVKYNADKRAGKIGKKRDKVEDEVSKEAEQARERDKRQAKARQQERIQTVKEAVPTAVDPAAMSEEE